jgi:hypothetical protein
MCTTRELVAQNLSVLRKMAKFSGITSTSTSEEGEDTAGARGRKLIEQVGRVDSCMWRVPLPATVDCYIVILLRMLDGTRPLVMCR